MPLENNFEAAQGLYMIKCEDDSSRNIVHKWLLTPALITLISPPPSLRHPPLFQKFNILPHFKILFYATLSSSTSPFETYSIYHSSTHLITHFLSRYHPGPHAHFFLFLIKQTKLVCG